MTRWENPLTHRYYEARVCRDLFGQWEILRTWGRIGSALGRTLRDPQPGEQACDAELEKISLRRQQRGYARTPAPASQ
ncbi:WGR domain-containing protein [Variovorax sp. ZS18.2.2]|uniref:WGR domain-containing protein n=1 Tax=Variovorax sp. ZS18.2.2 TaxID=2971255 RepID=UPI00215131B6|nr:WGR domain-containing protein [Variovorax sp. ZS18.2.2]MCR6481068.1 WGR domain-containing protein [Variovorax sp. ZS18.2.2]